VCVSREIGSSCKQVLLNLSSMPSKRCATSAKRSGNCSLAAVTNRMACQSRCEIQVQASRRRLLSACSSHSTRPSPRAWAWAYLSAARIIEAHGGRLWGSRGEPQGALFQFTIPLTEPPSVIDVAYWHETDMWRVNPP